MKLPIITLALLLLLLVSVTVLALQQEPEDFCTPSHLHNKLRILPARVLQPRQNPGLD